MSKKPSSAGSSKSKNFRRMFTLKELRNEEDFVKSGEIGVAHESGDFRLRKDSDPMSGLYYWTVEKRTPDGWEEMPDNESPFLSKGQAEGAYVALLNGKAPTSIPEFREWKDKRYSGWLRD
jgi:hypothetical protein